MTIEDQKPVERFVPLQGLSLYLRQWGGNGGVPFVLVHGLASNCQTWDLLAVRLAGAGHPVVAYDQRGHGRSIKPDTGYGFTEVTADLLTLLDTLGWERPIIAGQSWGGNVTLDFAARYPRRVSGLVLVDGGFLEPSARGATWEETAEQLRPPPLEGTPRTTLAGRIRQNHPDWPEKAIEATLANFETLPDGTVRPWLSLAHHMEILRAMWEHHPPLLYPKVTAPALIAAAANANTRWLEAKHRFIQRAEAGLARCWVRWFADTDHDIHLHRPDELAAWVLTAMLEGFFGD